VLSFIIEQFTALIEPIQNLSKEKRELKDNALRSISHALNETYLYYSGLTKGKPRNEEIEKQLSNYWAAAAIPLRHLNENLAMTCEYKADYWVNPDNWTDEQIEEHEIALDLVRGKYRNLLAPKAKTIRIEPKIT
jgi:hypothetical protein